MARQHAHSVGRCFEAMAVAQPDRPALRFSDRPDIAFGALLDSARQAARRVAAKGAGPGRPLALFMEKAPETFALIHGALRARAPLVALDPESPPERLRRILETARPAVIALDRTPPPALEAAARAVGAVLLDRDALAAPSKGPDPDPGRGAGDDIAYIMFTSGSTGIPKGAAIAHASVLRFAAWAADVFGIGSADVLTNVNALHFDNSVFDLHAGLLNGACLAPVEAAVARDPHALLDRVEAAGCTLWFSVPSLLVYVTRLRALAPGRVPSLRAVVFGGEGYPKPDLKRLAGIVGDRVALWNVYGPTEGTCMCSAHRVTAADLADPVHLAPLGRIAPDFGHYILDADDRPCPDDAIGELCLTGPQLARGYWNDPERTAAAFVPDPLAVDGKARMYRTGDLVVRGSADGLIRFAGRKDFQIKHMGYRIEPEEIEAALNAVPGVTESVVARIGEGAVGQLVAAIVADDGTDDGAIREGLSATLPRYMIPGRFARVVALPRNANGKVDRRATAALLETA